MPRKNDKKKPRGRESLLELVEKMRATADERRVLHRLHHSKHPQIKRAFRIYRHLCALEEEILASAGSGGVELAADPASERVVLSIRHDAVHCCRFAYLSRQELGLLERNPKVARVLRACPAYDEVA